MKYKFRVFNKNNNQMDYDYYLLKDTYMNDFLNSDYLVFMRCHGFVDKNEKEVYEGDILKCWDATGQLLYGGKPICIGLWTPHNRSDLIEIVGNKWERPDMPRID